MTGPAPQDIYNAAQNMQAASSACRALIFSGLGGQLWPDEPMAPGEALFMVGLYGITGRGIDQAEALEHWTRKALEHHRTTGKARATDGRPDCPHNGAAPLPPATARVAVAA
ncbi:MAG: hypothetical protein AB3N13_09135 [Arenibacterium sp.]